MICARYHSYHFTTAPSLNFISMTLPPLFQHTIRSRLVGLGENTSTPGLSGEKRRNELMKRLVEGVCGNDDMMDELVGERNDILMSLLLTLTTMVCVWFQITLYPDTHYCIHHITLESYHR